MVFSGDGAGEELVMALSRDRSKPPLHNFNLPCLKWGNQKQLRCMKPENLINGGPSAASADRIIRTTRSPPPPDYEVRRFKKLKPINHSRRRGGDEEEEEEEGIEAVREKLMCDFKAAADRMKATIFRKGVVSDENHRRRRRQEEEEKEKSAAVVAETDEEGRPWNLRTRRSAAPVGGNSVNGGGGVSNSSPMRGEKKEEKEPARPKLTVALSRKEIDEDFMTILGHRPARRPKKRPRNVQKQLDMLFPGLWLTEVTVDTYKVPELPDNAKI
ncbi:hypothetical protein M5689_003041 [Euphorbia peplus]|nr:hypothetical protein M5689_003041 [Euphorbia peplus]